MQEVVERDGVEASLLELVEAAGFLTEESLTQVDAQHIYDEISKANQVLCLVETLPSFEYVSAWHANLALESEPISEPRVEQDLGEGDAIELDSPDRSLREHKAITAQMLSEEFVHEHALELETLPTFQPLPVVAKTPAFAEKVNLPVVKKESASQRVLANAQAEKKGIDVQRVKTFDEFLEHGGNVQPLVRGNTNDLTKAPKIGTNDGVAPSSKKYLRGVLHKEIFRTKLSAIVFLLCALLSAVAILPVLYVLAFPEEYMWVLLTPMLLFVVLVLYVSSANKATCPVCRQRQFVPKACRKHTKAHSLPLLGHMVPTALHMLLYNWFHCIFCGTSIRVKE